jgi:MFS family permease
MPGPISRPQQTGAAPAPPHAWRMVAAAFAVGFVVFGVMYSFGVFFSPISAELGASRTETSALFAATGLGFYLFGSLAGALGDRFGPRVMVACGSAVMGVGLVATSLTDRLWLAWLSYGLGVGAGAACAYVPSLAIVGGWFASRRGTALGIAAAGTGCGMLIVPPVAAALVESEGWRVANIILGIGSAAILLACAAMVRPPPRAPAASRGSLGPVLRSPSFLLLYASWVLATTALFVPFLLLPAFAIARGAGEVAAASLLSVIGGMSVVGRLGIGVLTQRIGALPLLKLSVLLMAASYVLWLVSSAYPWLLAFAAVLGIGYGVRIALMPVVLIELFGVANLGAILGAFFTASGIAAVLGPVLAAFAIDDLGSDQWGIALALATGVLGLAALLPLRGRMVPGVGVHDRAERRIRPQEAE